MRKRFTAGTMLIVMAAMLILSVADAFILYFRQTDAARQSLHELLTFADAQSEFAELPRVMASFQLAAPDKRLTVIGPDGAVLMDTDGAVESHGDRPEVLEAVSDGWGEIIRNSDTMGYRMLYVAKRFSGGMVGRAAMPISTVWSLVWTCLSPLLGVALLCLSLTYALSRRAAIHLVRPLEAIGEDLMTVLNGGSPTALEKFQADHELRAILRYIRLLVERFKSDMEEIRAERDRASRMAEELKKAENIRGEFTANVSHELKTPLTSIRGSCELLSQGMVKPEDQPRFFTLISVEVERLIALINDILELSELENVTIPQPDETASPLEAASEVEELLRTEAEQKGIAVVVRGDDGLAHISPEKLRELLVNLMGNAIRYGRENGGVEVTISRMDEQIFIAVADNGIGIPPEDQPHVFERFYRVDKGRSRQSGGTGLGLAIVKHICQLYGGTVSLKSRPGEGSIFTVVLPTM